MSYPAFNRHHLRRALARHASRFNSAARIGWSGRRHVHEALRSELHRQRRRSQTDSEISEGLLLPGAPPGVSADDRPGIGQTEAAALEQTLVASATPAVDLPDASDLTAGQDIAAQDNPHPVQAAAAMDDWKQAVVNTGDNGADLLAPRRECRRPAQGHDPGRRGQHPQAHPPRPGSAPPCRCRRPSAGTPLRGESTLGLHVTRDGDQFAATSIHRIPDRQTAPPAPSSTARCSWRARKPSSPTI